MQNVLNRLIFLVLAIFMYCSSSFATHNRAGEITYTHVSGLTYEVLITTYTKESSPADRPVLYLFWGDSNELDSLEREDIDYTFLNEDIQINTYRGIHNYGGPGTFEIVVEDPNRNEGVLNMFGSSSFCLVSIRYCNYFNIVYGVSFILLRSSHLRGILHQHNGR